jgi:hypothetical protein
MLFYQHTFLFNSRSNRVFGSLQRSGWDIRTAGIWRWVLCPMFRDNVVVYFQRSVCPRWNTRAEFLLGDLYLYEKNQYLFSKRLDISTSLSFNLNLPLQCLIFSFLKTCFFPRKFSTKILYFLSPCSIYMSNHTYQYRLQNFISRILISLVNGKKKAEFLPTFHSHCRDWYDTAWPEILPKKIFLNVDKFWK